MSIFATPERCELCGSRACAAQSARHCRHLRRLRPGVRPLGAEARAARLSKRKKG